MMAIQTYQYTSNENGPKILISGAIHGNEKCGPKAIEWFKTHVENGDIEILKGIITLIPICNQMAYEKNIRFLESNLNRHFYPKDNPKTYEDHLANELSHYYKNTDILLDIHSYHSGGPPFVFVSPDQESELRFAQTLGVQYFLYGFSSGYNDPKEAIGTTEYTRLHGGYGVTLECGQHDDSVSIHIAKCAIIGALWNLNIIQISDALKEFLPPKISANAMIWFKIFACFKKLRNGNLRDINHFDAVSKGQILAIYDDGEEIKAPQDSTMIFPNHGSETNTEWFYLADKIER